MEISPLTLNDALEVVQTAQEIFLIEAGSDGSIHISPIDQLKLFSENELIIAGWVPAEIMMDISENHKASILIVNVNSAKDNSIQLIGRITGFKELAELDGLAAVAEIGVPQIERQLRFHVEEIKAMTNRLPIDDELD